MGGPIEPKPTIFGHERWSSSDLRLRALQVEVKRRLREPSSGSWWPLDQTQVSVNSPVLTGNGATSVNLLLEGVGVLDPVNRRFVP